MQNREPRQRRVGVLEGREEGYEMCEKRVSNSIWSLGLGAGWIIFQIMMGSLGNLAEGWQMTRDSLPLGRSTTIEL